MTILVCTLILLGPTGNREIRQAAGVLVKEHKDYVTIDFTHFYEKNRQYKDAIFVETINNNECLIKYRSAK